MNILLAFVSFLQTYCGICFFHMSSFFFFFLLQISFCVYLSHALLIFLYNFYNNLLLYLISRLCFFDNKSNQRSFTHPFLYIIKTPFISQIRAIHYVNCMIFSHIPKMNSVSTSFNINNTNIIKTHSFYIKSWQPLQR